MEVLLRMFVGLHGDSYCHFFSPSWNLFLLIFMSIFTLHFYFSDVQRTAVLPTASQVTAEVKLFGFCSCTTALSPWQRAGNKERCSSASQHCYRAIKCAFKSLRWVITPKRKKHTCPTVYLAVFILISLLLDYFFPGETLRPWKKEDGMISPTKTNKKCSLLPS